eukprot:jgi/Psemu1/32041/gm1.32041_g
MAPHICPQVLPPQHISHHFSSTPHGHSHPPNTNLHDHPPLSAPTYTNPTAAHPLTLFHCYLPHGPANQLDVTHTNCTAAKKDASPYRHLRAPQPHCPQRPTTLRTLRDVPLLFMPPNHTSTPHPLTSHSTFVLRNHPTDTPSHLGTDKPICLNMPATDLIHLQSKCITAGYLTPSAFQATPRSATSSKLPPKFGFPMSTPTAPSRLSIPSSHVGAHTDSIQAEILISFPSAVFAAFAISITPNNTLTLFRTWTDTTLLPDNFTSAADSTSQFLLSPLLWPTTHDIPVNHPVDAALPKGSYDNGFTTWLATMQFLEAKNQALSLHTHHSLFAAANWTNPGPGNTILSQLCNTATKLSTTTTWLQSTSPSPECGTACLPFIDEAHLTCLRAISSTQNTGATTADIRDLVHALKQPTLDLCTRDNSSRSALSWRIFLACVHSNNVTGEYTIHPATLSDASKTLFLDKHAFSPTAAFND